MRKLMYITSTLYLLAMIAPTHAMQIWGGDESHQKYDNLTYPSSSHKTQCHIAPSCDSLGYVSSSCPGGITPVKCPFDSNKVYCPVDCSGYPSSSSDWQQRVAVTIPGKGSGYQFTMVAEVDLCEDNEGTHYRITKCLIDGQVYDPETHKCVDSQQKCTGTQIHYPDGCRQPSYSIGDLVYWNSKPIGVVVDVVPDDNPYGAKSFTILVMALEDASTSPVAWLKEVTDPDTYTYWEENLWWQIDDIPGLRGALQACYPDVMSGELRDFMHYYLPGCTVAQTIYDEYVAEHKPISSEEELISLGHCSMFGPKTEQEAITNGATDTGFGDAIEGTYQCSMNTNGNIYWDTIALEIANDYKVCSAAEPLCSDWYLPNSGHMYKAMQAVAEGLIPQKYITKNRYYWTATDYLRDGAIDGTVWTGYFSNAGDWGLTSLERELPFASTPDAANSAYVRPFTSFTIYLNRN